MNSGETSAESQLIGAKLESMRIRLDESDMNTLLSEATFSHDLHYISSSLTSLALNSIQIFGQNESPRLLTRLLEHYFAELKAAPDMDDDTIQEPLRDLLFIIYKVSQKSVEFCRLLCENGMFHTILSLFENEACVEVLFNCYLSKLSHLLGVVYGLTKFKHHAALETTLADEAVLVQTRDLLERLSQSDDRQGMQDKPVLKLYLVCLAYVRPNLLYESHYEYFEKGYIQDHFKTVCGQREFEAMCELVEHEFVDEKGDLVVARVNKLHFVGATNVYAISTVFATCVDFLSTFLVLFAEQKQRGYAYFKNFVKSILYFGVNVERRLCLKCLLDFAEENAVREDLRNDPRLIDFLEKLSRSSSSELNRMICIFNQQILLGR